MHDERTNSQAEQMLLIMAVIWIVDHAAISVALSKAIEILKFPKIWLSKPAPNTISVRHDLDISTAQCRGIGTVEAADTDHIHSFACRFCTVLGRDF